MSGTFNRVLGSSNIACHLESAEVKAAVEQLSFVDMDLDAAELGGEVIWSPPTASSLQADSVPVTRA